MSGVGGLGYPVQEKVLKTFFWNRLMQACPLVVAYPFPPSGDRSLWPCFKPNAVPPIYPGFAKMTEYLPRVGGCIVRVPNLYFGSSRSSSIQYSWGT